MSTRIPVGKGTGRYRQSDEVMTKLARQPKNTQHSPHSWSKELGHDEPTVIKNLELARKPGVLAAYGGDPLAKVERVEVKSYDYRIDPEPLGSDVESIAFTNCEAIAFEQPTILDALQVVERCWTAYGPPGSSNNRPQPTEPDRTDASAPFDWSFLLPFVPGMVVLGVWGILQLLSPPSPAATPPPPAAKPAAAFNLFDFTSWLNSPTPAPPQSAIT